MVVGSPLIHGICLLVFSVAVPSGSSTSKGFLEAVTILTRERFEPQQSFCSGGPNKGYVSMASRGNVSQPEFQFVRLLGNMNLCLTMKFTNHSLADLDITHKRHAL